jgi:hypothetical protein
MDRLALLLFVAIVTWPLFLIVGIVGVLDGNSLAVGVLAYCVTSSVGLIRLVPLLPELWREMGGDR